MPDHISRQNLKMKVLDRWENEGGRILADQIGINKCSLADKKASKYDIMPISENPTANRPKGRKINEAVYEY